MGARNVPEIAMFVNQLCSGVQAKYQGGGSPAIE
jgi:hypothetical protein